MWGPISSLRDPQFQSAGFHSALKDSLRLHNLYRALQGPRGSVELYWFHGGVKKALQGSIAFHKAL